MAPLFHDANIYLTFNQLESLPFCFNALKLTIVSKHSQKHPKAPDFVRFRPMLTQRIGLTQRTQRRGEENELFSLRLCVLCVSSFFSPPNPSPCPIRPDPLPSDFWRTKLGQIRADRSRSHRYHRLTKRDVQVAS